MSLTGDMPDLVESEDYREVVLFCRIVRAASLPSSGLRADKALRRSLPGCTRFPERAHLRLAGGSQQMREGQHRTRRA